MIGKRLMLVAGLQVSLQLAAPLSFAQGFETLEIRGNDRRLIHVALPIFAWSGQSVVRVDANFGACALGIEGALAGREDDVSAEEAAETGESLVNSSQQVTLLLSRYSDPHLMGGWFFSVGAGYRTMEVDWRTTPQADDPGISYGMRAEDGHTEHTAVGKGYTGHLRGGYRYVPEGWPVALGLHIGVRHYQATFEDDDDTTTPLSFRQSEQLRRRFTSRFEPGIEFGFSF